jgi:phage-related protein
MTTKGERNVHWIGNSREVLRAFPEKVRWSLGRALHQAQKGIRPRISSPLRGRLRGVIELSEHDPGGAYRVYYSLKCPNILYVLFCHKKKSKRGVAIPKHEEDLILQRFKGSLIDCRERQEEAR